jgi:hypothetical protein
LIRNQKIFASNQFDDLTQPSFSKAKMPFIIQMPKLTESLKAYGAMTNLSKVLPTRENSSFLKKNSIPSTQTPGPKKTKEEIGFA